MDSVSGAPLIDLDSAADGTGSILAFAEGDAATALAPSAQVTGTEGWTLDGGTLSVWFDENGTPDDRLIILNGGGIDAAAGEVRFEGVLIGTYSGGEDGVALAVEFSNAATSAAAQALLRAIAYWNASDDPATAERQVKFVLADAGGSSVEAVARVDVSAADDPPLLDLNGADDDGSGVEFAFAEGDGPAALAPGATLIDLDALGSGVAGLIVAIDSASGEEALTIVSTGDGAGEIAVSGGAIRYEGVEIGTFSGGGEGGAALAVSFHDGAQAGAVQALARAIAYANSSDAPAAGRSVTFTLVERGSGATSVSTARIALNGSNDPPAIDLDGGSDGTRAIVDYAEGSGEVAVAPAAAFADADLEVGGGTLTVSISAHAAAGDRLSIVATGTGPEQISVADGEVRYGGALIGSVAGGSGGAPLVVTFAPSASPAAVQALARSVAFSNESDDPGSAARTVTFEVADGDGGSVSATAVVNVAPANDAPSVDLDPVLDGTGAVLGFAEGDAATAIAPEAVIGDPDSAELAGGMLRVSFAGGASAGDALSILEAGGISIDGAEVSFGGDVIGTVVGGAAGADLVISFTAAATPEAVQALVRAVAFSNGSDDPSAEPRTVSFELGDGDGGSALSAATIEFATDGIVVVPVVADGSDQSAVINAILATSNASTVVLPAGEFMIGTNIIVPAGKTLIGAGQGATVLKVLPTFDFAHGNSSVEVLGGATLSGLTVDVNKANLGLGSALRVCGVMATGEGFLVESVTVKNATGYAFWGNGVEPHTLASGVFRECFAENANVLFETTHADGILFENCVGADGDGDITSEGVFHPVSNSNNITFKDSYYKGSAIAVSVVADLSDQKNIVFNNVHAEVTSNAVAVFADARGTFMNEIFFINSSFKAGNTNAAVFRDSHVYGTGSRFESYRIGFTMMSGTAEMVDSVAIGKADPDYADGIFGIYADAPVLWDGGTVAASGGPGSTPFLGNVTLTASTAVLRGEIVTASDAAPASIDVYANDSNPREASPVAAIAGKSVVHGQTVVLASGAAVTLEADGTLTYDSRGVHALAAVGSGAVNTTALDQFSYVLEDGFAGHARVTVNGAASEGDILRGDSRANSIVGSVWSELFLLHHGGDDGASGGAGDDRFYFGSELTTLDRVDGGEGTGDEILIQGDYTAGLALDASMVAGIERLTVLSASDTRFADRRGGVFNYSLAAGDDTLAAGRLLTIDGSGLSRTESLSFDGSAERDARFDLRGGGGADVLVGGRGDDLFRYDTLAALAGDRIDGGAGTDALVLASGFAGTVPDGVMTGIDKLSFVSAAGGQPGTISAAFGDSAVAAGVRFAIDSRELKAGDQVDFVGSAERDGSFDFFAGAGRDRLTGGAGSDSFFYDTAANVAGDRLNGGGGADSLLLGGRFTAAFAADFLISVEQLALASMAGKGLAYYNLTLHDANVSAGQMLTVDGSALRYGESIYLYAQNERDGSLTVTSGANNDYVYTGGGNDVIRGGLGADTLSGGGGDDLFLYPAAAELTGDRISGGAGYDTVGLSGYVSLGFAADALSSVERVVLGSREGIGFSYYNLTMNDSNVAAGQRLLVDGSALRYGETLLFYGQNERDGSFTVLAGANDDYLFGGAGADRLQGGIGRDYLRGFGGPDVFAYGSAAEATGVRFDQIVGFDVREDRIDLPRAVAAWSGTVSTGALRSASFDADLAAAVDGLLGADEAVLFRPNSGDHGGRIFAVVDANSDGSYRAGEDYVIEFVSPVLPLTLSTGLFI